MCILNPLYPTVFLPLFQITCPSGNMCAPSFLISNSFFCNGVQDCFDGSDEDPTFCASFNCSTDGRVGSALPEDEMKRPWHLWGV